MNSLAPAFALAFSFALGSGIAQADLPKPPSPPGIDLPAPPDPAKLPKPPTPGIDLPAPPAPGDLPDPAGVLDDEGRPVKPTTPKPHKKRHKGRKK